MVIYEGDVPGVGKRYEVELGDDERFVVIIHHDGKREIYRREHADADAEKLFTLTSQESNEAATALQGADFQPLDISDIDIPLGDAIIDWIEVPEDCPLAGQTLADAKIRERTGATIAVIQREGETIASPTPETILEVGDILLSIGTREEEHKLRTLIQTGSPTDQ